VARATNATLTCPRIIWAATNGAAKLLLATKDQLEVRLRVLNASRAKPANHHSLQVVRAIIIMVGEALRLGEQPTVRP